MTCKYNYKSISLKVDTVEKIKLLSETLEMGLKLSNAKTVTKLINDSFERQNNKGTIYVRKQYCKA
jgi:SRSO17 transposase